MVVVQLCGSLLPCSEVAFFVFRGLGEAGMTIRTRSTYALVRKPKINAQVNDCGVLVMSVSWGLCRWCYGFLLVVVVV